MIRLDSMKRPRVILADDHAMVRRGLCLLLEDAGVAVIVGEASTADELIDLLGKREADLLVTDFSMPSTSENGGVDMLKRIAHHWPDLPVVVLTMASSVHVIRTILLNGAKAVVGKADGAQELIQAMQAARLGRTCLSTSVRALMMGPQGDMLPDPEAPALSVRETEVLRLYASGLSVTDIANQLKRSRKTISRQKISAMEKLSLFSDLDIYEYARREGLRMP
jgi:two-component system capsular synthesis response regulator RcsB